MKLRALAKINLGLDVTGKREDGYHEVRMVMQTIQMYDQLEIKESKEPGIRLTTNLPFLPCNDGNLVYKAAKILMDEFDIRQGVDMNLTKFIPVAAGMAGGSSDAAAALVGINRMFQLGLTKRQLMERGVQIGADVPYCVMRGTALAEGIGEKLTSLPGVPMCYVLIGKPGINVSTKFVYGNLHLDESIFLEKFLVRQNFFCISIADNAPAGHQNHATARFQNHVEIVRCDDFQMFKIVQNVDQ